MTVTFKRKSQGGRPCLFGKPLTGAQRQARYRDSHPGYRRKANLFMLNWRKAKRLNAAAQQESKEK